MASITINGISIDPLAQANQLQAAGLASVDASQSNYILIQTRGPLNDQQKSQLSALGVNIQEYVPEDTYIASYQPADLNPIRGLPFVAWANVYLQGFKIPPQLRASTPSTALVGPAAAAAPNTRVPHLVDIVLHDDVDPNSAPVRERIAAAAHLDPNTLQVGRHKVRLTIQERYLNDIAAVDDVRHIEEVPARQLYNNVARPILNANNVVVNGTTYQGDGQIVAVADTGFDRGSTTDVHPAFVGRVVKLYALGRTSPDKMDDPEGHGTHVAGSVLGDGTSSSMGGAIQGTAPRARLVLQSMIDSGGGLGGIPIDLHDLFLPPYTTDGARVHTNSWGPVAPGLPYNAGSREIDDFVWTHQDCVICFAAGNSGTDSDGNGVVDPSSVGGEPAAKNCITVGASESNRPEIQETYGALRPGDFPANPLAGDRMANNPEGMAAFSSRGPTREGRIKPDVVAPGTSILSTRSRHAASVPTVFGSSSDKLFFFDAGTSMATPLVAGCVAVLRETLVKNGTPGPSAALLKALLINGAEDLTGQYSPSEAGPSPNNNSGWGRVNLAGSVIIPGPNANAGFGDGGPLKQGEENTIPIHIPEAQHGLTGAPTGLSPTLKVTLVWSDPPGDALQNDLDLIVRLPNGQERHGNVGTSKSFDRRNNVEQIVWHNIPPGDARIIVHAFRITNFPQPYAYAWRLS